MRCSPECVRGAGCTNELLRATRLPLKDRQGDPAMPGLEDKKTAIKVFCLPEKIPLHHRGGGCRIPNGPTSLEVCTPRRLSSSRKDYRERKTHPTFGM